jgi:hypothetical protein
MVDAFVRSFAVVDIYNSLSFVCVAGSFSPQLLIYSLYISLDQMDLGN